MLFVTDEFNAFLTSTALNGNTKLHNKINIDGDTAWLKLEASKVERSCLTKKIVDFRLIQPVLL